MDVKLLLIWTCLISSLHHSFADEHETEELEIGKNETEEHETEEHETEEHETEEIVTEENETEEHETEENETKEHKTEEHETDEHGTEEHGNGKEEHETDENETEEHETDEHGTEEHESRSKSKGASCKISLPQYSWSRCKDTRSSEVIKTKEFYKLTKPNHYEAPYLDQSINKTRLYFMADKFHSHWFNLYFLFLSKNLRSLKPEDILKKFNKKFESYDQYFAVPEFFKDYVQNVTNHSPHYKYASRDYPYFTDLRKNRRFLDDDYFAQQRLAGINPMTIKRVMSWSGWLKLKKKLNLNHSSYWKLNKKIIAITKQYLWTAILNRRIYVVEFPLLEGIKQMPDFIPQTRLGINMLQSKLPIAIFAVNKQNQLKVAAIQLHDEQGSKLYGPCDGYQWQLAKAQVEQCDGFVVQMYEHLLRTHLRMEPVCISLYRHLSNKHPLHQILKYHCRGLIPINKQGKFTLLNESKTLRSLFPWGNEGGAKLLQNGYADMKWNDIDLEANVKQRGMDDKNRIPFYPYRDDGALINDVLKKFSKHLIELYYKADKDVAKDYELQNMMNELSEDGRQNPDGGRGKIKGLPWSLTTKYQLAKFIKETIWIVIQHSSVNYQIAEYGATPPTFPTKLYDDPRQDIFHALPGRLTAILQGSLSHGLGSLHYDSLFDYGDEMACQKARELVKETYNELTNEVKPIITKRNKERYESGKLTNPFMSPDWIPNSIST